MSDIIKIKKGLNIKLKGKAEKTISELLIVDKYAVKPTDFNELTPKLTVQEGEKVKAGTPLFFDKKNPQILFTSPVSGTVTEINRGERRLLQEVVITADKEIVYELFEKGSATDLSKEQIVENLLKSGLWPFIKQRPYGIIANPSDMPKAIFISGFDTAPLAPDFEFILEEQITAFQAGIDILKKLTNGTVHVAILPESKVLKAIKGVQISQFKGVHPAGNVGVQIHHINPINKGDIVWTVNPQDVAIIGRLFLKGIYDATKVVALTGSDVKNPKYFRTKVGAQIQSMTLNNVTEGDLRYISGNVLTGTKISEKGYLGFYDSQITIIPEGNHFEFLGWALPRLNKFSMSRTFFSWLFPNKEYQLDTNINGGERAYVVTGEYEKVVPMDILPQQLIKAVMIGDIDKMENLGIYEVIEEDLALCDFVCTSKIEVQATLRKGLNLMMKEMN